MPADAEAWWALAAVAPGVDGGYWDVEVVGEILHGEEPVGRFHGLIVRPDPFRRVSGTLSETLQLDSISTMRHRWNGVGGGFLGWLVSLRKALWRKGFEGMVSSVPIRRQGLRQLC